MNTQDLQAKPQDTKTLLLQRVNQLTSTQCSVVLKLIGTLDRMAEKQNS